MSWEAPSGSYDQRDLSYGNDVAIHACMHGPMWSIGRYVHSKGAILVQTALGIRNGVVGSQLLHHAQAGGCQDPGGWVDAWGVLGHLGIELQTPGIQKTEEEVAL